MAYCFNCGENIESGIEYCSHCGSRVENLAEICSKKSSDFK